MIYLLTILLFIVLILNYRRTSKIKMVLIILISTFICYFSTQLKDVDNYTVYYVAISKGVTSNVLGVGWKWLCKIGNLFHMSYILFKSVIYCISLIILTKTIAKFTAKYNKVLLIYFLFPGLLDLIQIRFFFAATIAFIAVSFIFKKSHVFKNTIFAAVLIFISSLFHSSCLFYMIFLTIPFLQKFKIKNILFITFFVLIIFSLITPYLENILLMILPSSEASRILHYFSGDKTSTLAIIVYGSLFIFQILLSLLLYKSKIAGQDQQELKKLCILNILLFLSMPFVFIDSDFLRIQRPFIILSYIFYFNVKNKDEIMPIDLNFFKIKYSTFLKINFLIIFVMFLLVFNNEALLNYFSLT